MTIQQIAGWAAVGVFALLVLDMLDWNPIKLSGKTVPPLPVPPMPTPDGGIAPDSSLDSLRREYLAAEADADTAEAKAHLASIRRDTARKAYQDGLDAAKAELEPKPEAPDADPA